MTLVQPMTEERAKCELRGYRAALRRKLNADDGTDQAQEQIERASGRVFAAEQRLDAIRSQQPQRHQGAWA